MVLSGSYEAFYTGNLHVGFLSYRVWHLHTWTCITKVFTAVIASVLVLVVGIHFHPSLIFAG
jgi:hypothetical protein